MIPARELELGEHVRDDRTGARGIVEDDRLGSRTLATGYLTLRWVDHVWDPSLRDYLASTSWDLVQMALDGDYDPKVPLTRCEPVLRPRAIRP